jgi:hypothetical protein
MDKKVHKNQTDDFLESRMKNVGVICLIILVIFSIVIFFYRFKEKKDMTMKLKGFYSNMSQTFLYSKNINGQLAEWGWRPGYKNIALIRGNITSYLQVSDDCLEKPGKCMPDVSYKTINNVPTEINLFNHPSVKLKNGISFALEAVSSCEKPGSTCAVLYVDLNNIEPPNTFGKDLFVFLIINSETMPFVPYNAKLTALELLQDEKFGCNKKSKAALYCSAFLYSNGWSVDRRYPW